jgi:hypothetical protein
MPWLLALIPTQFLLVRSMVVQHVSTYPLTDHSAHPYHISLLELIRIITDIATNFGGDCTKWGIDTIFRKIKTDARLISQVKLLRRVSILSQSKLERMVDLRKVVCG